MTEFETNTIKKVLDTIKITHLVDTYTNTHTHTHKPTVSISGQIKEFLQTYDFKNRKNQQKKVVCFKRERRRSIYLLTHIRTPNLTLG